jgi:hypothetical protein
MNNAAQVVGQLGHFPAIVELEHIMREGLEAGIFEEAEVKLEHFFAPGVYVRQVTMPRGAAIVGKIHATEHVVTVLSGRVISFTEFEGQREIAGPVTFVTPAGTKRALYVLEECIWQTVHPTTLAGIDGKASPQDLATIEDTFIAKTREQFLELARSGGLLWLG